MNALPFHEQVVERPALVHSADQTWQTLAVLGIAITFAQSAGVVRRAAAVVSNTWPCRGYYWDILVHLSVLMSISIKLTFNFSSAMVYDLINGQLLGQAYCCKR